ncbi:MAG: disulfide bond formation protein DsbA [Methylotenera sp. 24-45-7]|jgi:thiol:disulfide interchange protein DsbA|nr:MAG: disulfide bond formation protein DsbA [Methylotenera sp. 24-45-7]OZA07571.1 MAG: disulfide bond formation protein DsbA [Methylotenera sp. 17-45-7]OZA53561.1 MAG: disulfide bond formation protein DsbA [Methylophilales bacterium 39-45-7]HQS37668.1 thiol:disulfide interchange protein DsbA/DsbL [Methylotenera sp.]HQS44699.1 thiol:disulfide interchange protein DsbA/DsbL [Methylotenera sp.]
MKKLFSALLLLASFNVFAADPQMGKDFDRTAQAIANENPNKIEVVELFWYGCGHCHHMETPLNAWVKKLPADVTFKRVPGLPNQSWAPMAKTFYALETLGLLEKLHTPLFDAIHKQKSLNPTDEKGAIDWVTKQSGLDKAKVEEAYNSFSTNANLKRAANLFRASGATGVPSLVINGQFITSSTMAGNNDLALKTADYIITNIRADKAKAGTPAKK